MLPAAVLANWTASLSPNSSSSGTAALASILHQELTGAGQKLQQYIGEIQRGRWLIVIAGLGGGFVLSCVWLLALRLAAGIMVWLSIIGANVLLLVCAGFCYTNSGLLGNAGSIGAVRHTALRDLGVTLAP